MTDNIIQYDEMVQAALIGVVKDILIDTAENGLPGEHHFYITFQTTHPDVNIPSYLKKRYEEDMTIVLQNQFWDLSVSENFFEISLSFNRNKEHLIIPFDSLLGFFDPSVDFGLHFNSDTDANIEIIETDDLPPTQDDLDNDKDMIEKDNIVALDNFRKKK